MDLTETLPAPLLPLPADAGGHPFGRCPPLWADFVAVDRDGTVWAFEVRPVAYEEAGMWGNTRVGAGGFGPIGKLKATVPNWEDTLYEWSAGNWINATALRKGRVQDSTIASLLVIAVMVLVIVGIVLLKLATHAA